MIRLLSLLTAALLFAGCGVRVPEPNLTLYAVELVQWHESGQYATAVEEAVRPARDRLTGIARMPRARRPMAAVVLDIDETSVSNWDYLLAAKFAITGPGFARWTESDRATAIPPTLALFKQAREAGILVFFITGRPESLRGATERQLRTLGYSGYEGLFMRPDRYDEKSIIPFKSSVREKLERDGWRIVLNMGDQWSDLKGGYAERTYKLPNPYYYIY